MFAEWYKPNCSLEYPLHGSGAVVDALVRGLQKFGGRISLRSHVENIVVEDGRAIGVKLRNGQVSECLVIEKCREIDGCQHLAQKLLHRINFSCIAVHTC